MIQAAHSRQAAFGSKVVGRRQLVVTSFRRGDEVARNSRVRNINDSLTRGARNVADQLDRRTRSAQQQVKGRTNELSRNGSRFAQKGRQVADDLDLGAPPKRTPLSYGVSSAIWGAVAGVGLLAPSAVSGLLINPSWLAAGPVDFLINPLISILALGTSAASIINWVQADAARAGDLDENVHRRLNAALSTFCIANTGLLGLALSPAAESYLGTSGFELLNIGGVAALATGVSLQLYIAATNFAKYSPEGYNAVADIKSWLKDSQNTFSGIDGIMSTSYALLTASFLASGLGYLVAPGLTLKGVFGPGAGDGPEELLLWQLIGAGVAMLLAPVAYSLKEAAADNLLSGKRNKILNAGLVTAGVGHLLILQPFLGSYNSGPLFPIIFGTWATAALVGGFNLTQRPRF